VYSCFFFLFFFFSFSFTKTSVPGFSILRLRFIRKVRNASTGTHGIEKACLQSGTDAQLEINRQILPNAETSFPALSAPSG
jgi:hypothetical protein